MPIRVGKEKVFKSVFWNLFLAQAVEAVLHYLHHIPLQKDDADPFTF